MKPWVFIAAMLLAAGHVDAKTLKGMNLAGAAYSADVLPGRPEVDFTYPTGQELDYFAKKGMTIVRVPVLWERLQPDLGGELDGAELARLVSIIGSAEAYGMRVVVDIHNYGAYRSALVGTGAVSADQFAAFWARLARHLKAHGNAMFGLMNEPQQGDAQAWMIIIQKTIDAIWAVGAEQLILVAGTAWDGVHSFVQVSGPFAARLHDPLQRTWFEMHEYFDENSTGTHETCVSPERALARFTEATKWLRDSGRLGFVGEFGVSRRPECLQVLDDVLRFLEVNQDVWAGWTYWAAGPWWGEYMFTLEPKFSEDRPQMAIIQQFLK